MKSFKNAQQFALSMMNLALNPVCFADGTVQGGGTPQENADLANRPITYGFEDQLRSIIMQQIHSSEDVTLSDDAADNADLMSNKNPTYKLADSITSQFSTWFQENGIDTAPFKALSTGVEGELLEEGKSEAVGNV